MFCKCSGFRDPATPEAPPPAPLSEKAEQALKLLAANPAFKHVKLPHLREFAEHGQRRLFLKGAVIMYQGDASDSVHILVRGSVKVERGVSGNHEVMELAELMPGEVVGEMGVLNGDPRSATVTALEDTETLQITRDFLKATFQRDPDVLMAIMQVIMERLKSTDEMVETSLRVALEHLGS